MTSAISGVLDKLELETRDDSQVSVRDVLDAFGTRAFAPLLLIPATIMMTPLGALPGMPAVVAIVVCCSAIQLCFNREHPWVPEFIESLSIDRRKLLSTFRTIRSPLEKIERLLKPRFERFTEGNYKRIIGGICVLLGLSMIPLGIIPFAVILPAIAIVMLAASLLVSDGLLTLIGIFLTVGPCSFTAIYFLSAA